MNITRAVNITDRLKPNSFSLDEKVKWLNDIDSQIYKEIVLTHEGAEGIQPPAYTCRDSMDKVLIAPSPYDDLYIKYLCSQIDYYNNELARYNNSAMMFNVAYMSFYNYYNRTHTPNGERLKVK